METHARIHAQDLPRTGETTMFSNDRVTLADELKAELDGTADRGRQISDEDLQEWMDDQECAAFRRAEWHLNNPQEEA